jgi:hypothetical protein
MPLRTKKGGEGIEPVPAGTHQAVCYGVIELGTQHNEYFNKDQEQVLICWELSNERIDIEKNGERKNMPRVISKIYTNVITEKSNLAKDLASWRGKAMSEEEIEKFDLFNVIGKNCLVTVVHAEKNRKTYANVQSVGRLMKGMPERIVETPVIKFSFEDNGNNVPEEIPEWIANIIKKSREFTGEPVADPQSEYQENPDYDPDYVPPDDDVPF